MLGRTDSGRRLLLLLVGFVIAAGALVTRLGYWQLAQRDAEVTTARGVVEVTEVTRGGTPVRTGRFMASRLVALVEHPARETDGSRVDVTTQRRMRGPRGEDPQATR